MKSKHHNGLFERGILSLAYKERSLYGLSVASPGKIAGAVGGSEK